MKGTIMDLQYIVFKLNGLEIGRVCVDKEVIDRERAKLLVAQLRTSLTLVYSDYDSVDIDEVTCYVPR